MAKTKKYFIFLAVLLVAITSTFVLCSCGETSPSGAPSQSDETLTAVEKLNEKEKGLYDCLVEHLMDFVDPASVKVVIAEYDDNQIIGNGMVKISAKNSYGGRVSSSFYYGDFGYLSEPDDFLNDEHIWDNTDMDAIKINAALDEYKQSIGWLD